jgi:thiosulfate reductase cytochrome b subunit
MPGTRDNPQSVEERLDELDDRLLKLDSSRRWHFWVLILLVFTTCGYGTVDTTTTDTGLLNDSGVLRRDVRRVSDDVNRLNDEVESLREDLESAQDELQRLSGGGP